MYDKSCVQTVILLNFFMCALVSSYWICKGFYHCDRLSGYRHRLLNLLDTRRTTQHWQNIGRSVGLVLIGKAGNKTLGICAV